MHHNLIIKDGNTTKVVKEVLVDGIQFVDEAPREGSTNFVTSDGVNKAIGNTKESVDKDVQDLQQQIDDIAEKAGSGYTPKGEAAVATLNALSGQENGELYTLTDDGTLTDGSIAVVAGDTVAWDDANSVWYKAMNYVPVQYGTDQVKNLPTSITSFRSGDVIPVDGPSGTAKMTKDDLLRVTAENALGSIHNLTTSATEDDLVAGNYLTLDGANTKKLPAEYVAKRSVQDELGWEIDGSNDVIVPSYKSGYVTNNGSFGYTAPDAGYTANSYNVSRYKKVKLKTSVQHNAKYASFYAGEPSSNPSMGLITFRADGELELDVPEGATLLIVNSIFNGVGDVADVVLENDVEGLNKKVKELQEEVDGEYEAITPSYKNGYVTNTGSWSSYAVTGYIANSYDVSQSEKVVLKTSVQHNAKYASFYAGDPSSNPSMGLITFDAEGELDLNVPEGATLLIVNSVFNGVGDVGDVVLENQVTEGINKKIKKINVRLAEVESTVSLLDWSDKTWLMIGDSLTEKNFRAQVSYYDYVKQVTKVNLLNKGKSGDGYVHGDWFYTALGQVSASSFDFCTMFGSGNDLRYEYTSLSDRSSWEEALGDVDDNGTMSICGYMNRAISRFFELFPLKRIGIVTPTKWKNASLGDVQITDEETMRRMTDYSRALVQIANKWGIPVLDLFLSCGLQPQIEAYRIEFYNENGVQDPGVHPNSKGHKLIYKQFLDFLNVNLIS